MSPSFTPAVLLVDGYNIIGAWSCLKKTCDNFGLETARNELLEALVGYSAFTGYQTQVVFDAHFQKNGSNEEVVTKLVTAFYTDFGQTADTYIEKLVRVIASESTRTFIIASSCSYLRPGATVDGTGVWSGVDICTTTLL